MNAAPIYKGSQVITGDVFPGLYGGGPAALKTTHWNFNLSTSPFSGVIIPGNIYYLQIVISASGGVTDTLFSEPFYVYGSDYDYWGNQSLLRNSLFFNSKYKANRAANTNVVVSGWFSDAPTNTVPYSPSFTTRCEGYLIPSDMKLINIGYLQQQYQQNFITGQQVPQRVLKIGELSRGIPDYMLEKITEFLIADTCSITQDSSTYFEYKLWNPSAQTSPTDFWKTKRDDNHPLITATAPLTLGSLAQQFLITPIATPPGRYHDASHDSSHN